jgi:hypothetical protein
VPACAKSSCSSFSVVLKERLPTYSLVPIEFILETPLGHCSRLSDFKSPLNKLQLTIHQLPSFRLLCAISKVLPMRKQQRIRGTRQRPNK